MKKICPDVKVTIDEIKDVMTLEVLKREVLEGEKANEANKKIIKVFKALNKKEDIKEGVN